MQRPASANTVTLGNGKIGYGAGAPGVTPPTTLDLNVLNSVDEEIAGVVESAGITLANATYTQLLAALRAMIGSGSGPGLGATGGSSGGAGVVGTGGASNGVGVSGTGGATNGDGVSGTGTGSGRGVYGYGGATDGIGVLGQGRNAGTGVYAQAGATGAGLTAIGGSTSGYGISVSYNSSVSAPLHLPVQGSAPTGPNAVGDIYVATGGVLKICTVAGTPGTWTTVGTQT